MESEQYGRYRGEYSERLVAELSKLFNGATTHLFASASAAIETTLRAAGVGPGSHVAIAAYDYPGNFWAIERAGGRPLLIDLKAGQWCLCADQLCKAFENSSARPSAVIASHLHGQLAEMHALRQFCDEHDVLLIEDACQALGGQLPNEDNGGRSPAKSNLVGTLGHVGVISFGGGKTVSAGRGGACFTQDENLAQRIRIAAGAGSGPYELSELQAATVLGQLDALSELNLTSQAYFTELADLLSDRWSIPWLRQGTNCNAFYQAGLILSNHCSLADGHRVEEAFTAHGIAIGRGFVGFHRRSKRRCDTAMELQNTAAIVERTFTLHHRLAIGDHVTAKQLAELLNS